MNREFKFRVWDKFQNKFIDGIPPKEYMLDPDSTWSHRDIDDDPSVYINNVFRNDFKGRLIFLQYTGLKDSKNKEIYEGDIILWSGEHYAVEWDDLGFKWSAVCPYRVVYKRATTIEHFRHLRNGIVAGNIFETPNLLKKT